MPEQNGHPDSEGTPALLAAPRPEALDERETAEFLARVRVDLRRPSAAVAADAHRLSQTDGAADLIPRAGDDPDGAVPAIRRWIAGQDIDQAAPTRAPAPRAAGLAARERDERQTTRVRRIIERNLVAVRLEQMRSWQNQAMGRLQDLAARRNGLGANARPLAAAVQPQIRATVRRLLHEMSENAFAISVLEGKSRRWWAAVEAGREAVRLRRETALEASGAALPELAKAHLQFARALFMLKGNSPELRASLAQARQELPASPKVAYRFAQYHIMAGEHAAAYAAIQGFRNDPRIARDLLPLIDTGATRAPWQAYPCNFYTYRNSFAGDDRLNLIKEQLVAILTYEPAGGDPAPAIIQAAVDRAVAEATSTAAAGRSLRQDASADDPALEDVGSADWRVDPSRAETYDDVMEKRARASAMRARASARAGAAKAEAARIAGITQAAAEAALETLKQKATLGLKAIDGFLLWNVANRAMRNANFASAAKYYEDCRLAILAFFQARYQGRYVPIDQEGIYSQLVKLTRDIGGRVGSTIAEHFRLRNQTLTLEQLYDRDWVRPVVAPSGQNIFKDGTELLSVLTDDPAKGEEKLDAPLLTIAVILAGFALVESHRMRRAFDSALSEARQIQRRHAEVKVLSQVIEVPFLKILTAEIILEKGDAEYRARTPAASDPETRWNWITSSPPPLSGQRAHQSAIADGVHQHFFEGATATLSLAVDDVLFSNVYIDPANPPTEMMLQWNDGAGWEHRAFWGTDEIPFGVAGQGSRRRVGDLPPAGQWVRLQVPAADVGLGVAQLSGMAFTLFGGRAAWDRSGKTAANGTEVVWVDDELPAGARVSGEFLRYQGLQAAPTYLGVLQQFQDQGQYISKVNAGIDATAAQADALLRRSFHPLVAREPNGTAPPLLTPAERQQFQALGLAVPIDTIAFDATRLAANAQTSGAYVTLTDITVAPGQPPPKETNPLIFAVLAEAKARLTQLEADLNYLGYRDDYVPPWRFQFLLERARHFTDAARNGERDYLNFLRNAEDEESKEMSTAQNVVLEKGNVRVEMARVAQDLQQVEAAQQGSELAGLAARDADARVTSYRDFASHADGLANEITSGAGERQTVGVLEGIGSGALTGASIGSAAGPYGAAIGAVIGAVAGGIIAGMNVSETERANQLATASMQRQEELRNLRWARDEAARAADVAAQQLVVSRAALTVGALQLATTIMRHEFAVQNLTYVRNRTIGSELWYRLAHAIRGVSERYLRYAVEAAFLAEQAYEFEADKQINVIRFDYDDSEEGSILAGDFLNADLDTLEQDLIVTQRLRQQTVRYVVSMAREFPDALQVLRETGSAILHVPLQRLEQRLPGLFNLRIGDVFLQPPIALMDPRRFSMQLTHLGVSEVRLGSYTNPTSGAVISSWLPGIDATWPPRLRLSPPATSVFSGLTRADERETSPLIVANQRSTFENLGAAAAWNIDLSMRENQIIPESLADVEIVFVLTGYYDPALRDAIETGQQPRNVLTRYLSATQVFPDAYYDLHRTGVLSLPVARDLLSLRERVGTLRNAGIILVADDRRPQFSGLMCSCVVEFTIDAAGSLTRRSEIPELEFIIDQLALTAHVTLSDPFPGAPPVSVTWDFGDGTAPEAGTDVTHDYQRPGKYEVGLRVLRNERLTEFRIGIAVSRARSLAAPLTTFPALSQGAGAPIGQTRIVAEMRPGGATDSATWRLAGNRRVLSGDSVSLDLPPGDYTLIFTAVRRLAARFYCRQRYLSSTGIAIDGLRIASNRRFDDGGAEIDVAGRNALANHLFSGNGVASPVDTWSLELPVAENPFLSSADVSDNEEIDLGLSDVLLTLEYETLDD